MSRRLVWFFVPVAAIVVLLVVSTRVPPPPESEAVPNPNGYDDFVVAISLLKSDLPPVGKETPDELERYCATNQPAMERLRQGLSRRSLAPPYHPTNAQAHLDRLAGMKRLWRVLEAEADQARSHQEWDSLVSTTTHAFDFGLRLARGGVILDQTVATAAEARAIVPLVNALPDLPAGPARKAAAGLLALDAAREPFSRVRLREVHAVRRHASVPMRVAIALFLRRRMEATYTTVEARTHATVLDTRHLVLNLAARAYALDRGKAPENPAALVPDYLASVPLDPNSGKPILAFKPSELPQRRAP